MEESITWSRWWAFYPVHYDEGGWTWLRWVEVSRQWIGAWGDDRKVTVYRRARMQCPECSGKGWRWFSWSNAINFIRKPVQCCHCTGDGINRICGF